MDEHLERYIKHLEVEEKKQLTQNLELISRFRLFCLEKGLSLKDENFRYLQTIGIVAISPNILYSLCPAIVFDKEGLVDFNILKKVLKIHKMRPGMIVNENFLILASPYFRRGYYEENNFAPRFIELFWSLDNLDCEQYISLDANRLRVDVNGPLYFERDTWYGARFNKKIEDICDGVVKLRPPSDINVTDIGYFFANAYSLDILWTTKGGIKTFQLEEFKTEEITVNLDSEIYYPVRYIHAEYDLETSCFRHFDGAIHFYTKEEYFQRRESDFNYNEKSSTHLKPKSMKLFKFNGNIPVEVWIKFTSQFLTGNPLIIEYFQDEYPDYVNDALLRIRSINNK